MLSSRRVARFERWQGDIGVTVLWENGWPCGCLVLEGVRWDRNEAVVGCWPCGDKHQDALAGAREALAENPEPRPLHDVVAERLSQVNLDAHAA